MSTAPDGYTTPRTTWTAADPIFNTDLNRIESNTSATELGNRTIDQDLATPGNVGTLRQVLSWFAGRLRAITGAANWFDTPATTLTTAHAHHGAAAPVHGSTAAATAGTIIQRDAAGRAQVAAPAVAADIATKLYVDDRTNAFLMVAPSDEVRASADTVRLPSSTSFVLAKTFVATLSGRVRIRIEGYATDGGLRWLEWEVRTFNGTSEVVVAWGQLTTTFPLGQIVPFDMDIIQGHHIRYYHRHSFSGPGPATTSVRVCWTPAPPVNNGFTVTQD